MEPEILRVCAFRRAEGNAGARRKSAKPFLKFSFTPSLTIQRPVSGALSKQKHPCSGFPFS